MQKAQHSYGNGVTINTDAYSFIGNYFLPNYNSLMKNKAPSYLKQHFGFSLRTVSNQVSHSFARKVEESGATVAEWVIIREMYSFKKPFPPSTLAEITMLSRGAVSKLIERLVSKGLVLREDSKGDRRFQQISLTKAGENLVPKLAKFADENDEFFFRKPYS